MSRWLVRAELSKEKYLVKGLVWPVTPVSSLEAYTKSSLDGVTNLSEPNGIFSIVMVMSVVHGDMHDFACVGEQCMCPVES